MCTCMGFILICIISESCFASLAHFCLNIYFLPLGHISPFLTFPLFCPCGRSLCSLLNTCLSFLYFQLEVDHFLCLLSRLLGVEISKCVRDNICMISTSRGTRIAENQILSLRNDFFLNTSVNLINLWEGCQA